MRELNWKQYNKELVQRGSLTFLFDPKFFKHPKSKSKRGRPLEFSKPLIIMLMMIKIHHRCSYRFLEGFIKSIQILSKVNGAVPSYSLICKRASYIQNFLPQLSTKQSRVIILDASGVKIYGEGEWRVKMHGKGLPRKWIKIHIALDEKTQDIVAEATTESTVVDSKMTQNLLNQIEGRIKTTICDGAYDKRMRVLQLIVGSQRH